MTEERIRRLREDLYEKEKEGDILLNFYTSKYQKSINKRLVLEKKFQESTQAIQTLNTEIAGINLTHHTKTIQLQLRYTMDTLESIINCAKQIVILSRKEKRAKQEMKRMKKLQRTTQEMREWVQNIENEYKKNRRLVEDQIREKKELENEILELQKEYFGELKRYNRRLRISVAVLFFLMLVQILYKILVV